MHTRDTSAGPRRNTILGWDIGGAHVKAALLRDGVLADVCQWPAPLWQGLDRLDRVIDEARARWGGFSGLSHALTMTAEMTDLFPDRPSGVGALADRLANRLGPALALFGGSAGWIQASAAAAHWRALASANWLATAHCVAQRCRDAVLLDIGSTTTDIVPVRQARPAAGETGDMARLASGGLVYLGIVRTPLCALAERIEFGGREFNVMNELFATSADLFRLSGELDPDHDQQPAADDGPRDAEGSARRLARMIGHDLGDAPLEQWRELAARWALRLEDRIAANLRRVAGDAGVPARAPIVGAGCGLFLARRLARGVGRRLVPFHRLVDAPPALAGWADCCAPAVAVARLYAGGAGPCG